MKRVYELTHKRIVEIIDDEEIVNTKLLGFFSSNEKCQEAINFYLNQEGFKKYPTGFVINEVEADVDEYNNFPGNFNNSVYYLAHEWYDGEYDYVTDIGYYSTLKKAEDAKMLSKFDEEFINNQDGFSITEYIIDKMHWTDGFCSWDDM